MKHFEILNKLNELDTKNGTALVGICNEVVSVDQKGHNGFVKIGIPGNIAQELVLTNMENKSLQLLIIDIAEYNTVKSIDDNSSFKDMLPQAIHVLSYNLRCDEDYRRSWIDNIAMAFKDACKQHDIPEDCLNAEDIHNIANEAAKNFIGTLTQTNAAG